MVSQNCIYPLSFRLELAQEYGSEEEGGGGTTEEAPPFFIAGIRNQDNWCDNWIFDQGRSTQHRSERT
ncbi:hypothetical protein RHMOL_Rhmol05G0035500 [Rhododendron molle]|uniref:Uncharacterized protein n=1 Tax=Rhododendron molle TaxID=49168 RepID=A0ACC0NL14_RHOML|nr:hypothetical protein RHMOL_Rhmol05G0035500 [Rhododendron molle]